MSDSDDPLLVAAGEPHYRDRMELIKKRGIERLGLTTSWAWHDDPRHLLFSLSRYKFVAKLFTGCERVLEIGCADGFSTRIVAQQVSLGRRRFRS